MSASIERLSGFNRDQVNQGRRKSGFAERICCGRFGDSIDGKIRGGVRFQFMSRNWPDSVSCLATAAMPNVELMIR
jgi:hypothetical protein